MISSLKNKLKFFNPNSPYVWKLKITEDEFRSLEEDLCSYTLDASKKDDALKMLVYLAEWYKRRYTNRAKKDYQKTFDGKKPNLGMVWETLDIDEQYLYRTKEGSRLYLYSTFVLGGLAVNFELQKNEKPFIRSLCRVLNEEDDSFDDKVEKGDAAIAFKQSIAQHHSLYAYLRAIIDEYGYVNKMPFAKEDIKNTEIRISELLTLIKTINDEVQRSKFRLEWIVNAPYGDNLISRYLRLWLNPEKHDASKRHILKHDWLTERWGMKNPGNQHYVRIGLRYLMDEKIVKEPDFNHPEMWFSNTGCEDVGFRADVVDYKVCKNVPTTAFNKVQIICWDDSGTEYDVISEEVNFDVKQLYRIEVGEDLWSDRKNPQKETALLFSNKWKIADASIDKLYERKTFYNRKSGEGVSLSWCYVHASVTIESEGESRTFYNRQGHDHIVARLYNNTINYSADGKVMLHYAEDEDSPEKVTPISLIFGKQDIVVYHTETKDGEDETCKLTDIDLIEYKNDKDRYVPWTDTEVPEFGYVELRLSINGKQPLSEVFYLPKPIERNLEENTIHYCNLKEEQVYEDKADIENAVRRKQVLEPTILLNIGTKTCYVSIPVFRPTKLKEIFVEGKLVRTEEADSVCIPYVLKNDIVVNLYGEFGYVTYNCSNLGSIYPLLGELSNSHLNTWEHAKERNATQLDPYAPECLYIKFGDKFDKCKHRRLDFYYWNYSVETEPQRVEYGTKQEKNTVIFQSLKKVNAQLVNVYPSIVNSPFGNKAKADLLKCFEVATAHKVHYFAMKPLLALENEKERFVKEVYKPLVKKYGGKITEDHIKGLKRLADEFKFEWTDYEINIKNQI